MTDADERTIALYSNAVVTSETKLKQNKRKTMFVSVKIVLFQFYFRCNHCLIKLSFAIDLSRFVNYGL